MYVFETVISCILLYHCFIFMASWTFTIMKWLLFLDRHFLRNSASSDFNCTIEDFFFLSLYGTHLSILLLPMCLCFYVYYAKIANGSWFYLYANWQSFSFNYLVSLPSIFCTLKFYFSFQTDTKCLFLPKTFFGLFEQKEALSLSWSSYALHLFCGLPHILPLVVFIRISLINVPGWKPLEAVVRTYASLFPVLLQTAFIFMKLWLKVNY